MDVADRPIPERLAECEQDILRTRGQQLVHEQRGDHTQAQATSHRIAVLLDIWAQLRRMNDMAGELTSLIGIRPGMTGGLPANEWVRRNRASEGLPE